MNEQFSQLGEQLNKAYKAHEKAVKAYDKLNNMLAWDDPKVEVARLKMVAANEKISHTIAQMAQLV